MKQKLVSSSPSKLEWVTLYYDDLSAFIDLIKGSGDDVEIEFETDKFSECNDISELREKLGAGAKITDLSIRFSPGYNHVEFYGYIVRLYLGAETTEAFGLKVLLFDFLKKRQNKLLVVVSNGWFIASLALFGIASTIAASLDFWSLAAVFAGVWVIGAPFILYCSIVMVRWRPIRLVEYRASRFFDKNTIIKLFFGTLSVLATAISGIVGVAYSEQIKAFFN